MKFLRDGISGTLDLNLREPERNWASDRAGAVFSNDFKFGWSDSSLGKPTYKQLAESFRSNNWVRANVNLSSLAVSALPWKSFDPKGNEIERNQIESWIKEGPNLQMSWKENIYRNVMHLQIGGEFYELGKTAEQENIATPKVLFPVDPGKIEPQASEDFLGMLIGFKSKNKSNVTFNTLQMFQGLYPDPESLIKGVSPLEACWPNVHTLTEAYKWLNQVLENKAQPPVAWSLSNNDTVGAGLNHEKWEKFIQSLTSGAVGKHVYADALKPTILTYAPADMGVIGIIEDARLEIASSFGIPMMLLGDMRFSTLSNFEQALKDFYGNVVIPIGELVAGAYNRYFSKFRELQNVKLGFKKDEIPQIQEDPNQVTDRQVKEINNAIKTPNEVRAENGMDSLGSEGDKPLVGISTQLLGDATGENIPEVEV